MTLEIYGFGGTHYSQVMAGVWGGENISFKPYIGDGVNEFTIDGKVVAISNLPFAIILVEPSHK